MTDFKRFNNIAGWCVFAVSLVVYLLTASPVADWWDCMEFTATSYKLEVGHPPGAPLFMMLMRLFTMWASPEGVGFAGNVMSCVASAFCILFMFWTISRLAIKMHADQWTAIGAAAIGSLAYAFTDTFWFSAVESEVYATSSMFTALVVWLMMRWEEVADEPGSDRWLVLIAYMMGLSIGVHILNLLTIPALALIWYFRKTKKVTLKGGLLAVGASMGILGVFYLVLMPLPVSVGAWFDRVAVNSFGLPVNSGFAFFIIVLLALVGAGVWATHKRGKRLWNTVLLCVGVVLIGYSSYASVVIRSSVNPPMNSNRPDNPYALQDLLGRSQYGRTPLLYGPRYDSRPMAGKYEDVWSFSDERGEYVKREVLVDYEYAPGEEMLFPRQWDHNAADKYKAWTGVETGGNLSYFFGYQLNFMYWRYFMWNFVGRQDDIKGEGDILHGNWLSGVDFIDELYLGPQDDLPDEVERNKGRNKFFFLPFILGILGLVSQMGKDRRGFVIVTCLFVMMGVALVVYFNSVPGQVRERDYIYAGSFYAFSIWIGLGVVWVRELFERLSAKYAALVATVICLCVPTILLAGGWDDHDRSHRRIGHDVGYNYLISTLPNAIILNFGDNDTFPLWYNQEVENLRPDVRIMNMSYIGANWYIEQMRHAYNQSKPVPLSISMEAYADNDYTYVEEVVDRHVDVRQVVEFVSNRDRQTRLEFESGRWADYIPTRKLALPVDRDAVLRSGIVRPEDAHLMVDTIYFELPEGDIRKDQLVLLDLLANFGWERPLCATTFSMFEDVGLGDWLQADGWTYRLVPIRTKFDLLGVGRVDTGLFYELVMDKYKYGGANDPRVYVDYNSLTNLRFVQFYNTFVRLANSLLDEGDREGAVRVLDRALTEYPASKFDYDFTSTYSIIEAYYAAGAPERGDVLLEDYANTLQQYSEYYLGFTGGKAERVSDVLYAKLRDLAALEQLAAHYERTEQLASISAYLDLFTKAAE